MNEGQAWSIFMSLPFLTRFSLEVSLLPAGPRTPPLAPKQTCREAGWPQGTRSLTDSAAHSPGLSTSPLLSAERYLLPPPPSYKNPFCWILICLQFLNSKCYPVAIVFLKKVLPYLSQGLFSFDKTNDRRVTGNRDQFQGGLGTPGLVGVIPPYSRDDH